MHSLPKTLTWRGTLATTLHSDLGAIGSERPFPRSERTEIAIAMATETGQPVALRGFGRLYVSICLCPADIEGHCATFSGYSDFSRDERLTNRDTPTTATLLVTAV